jgi:integrase/recombinase XerD
MKTPGRFQCSQLATFNDHVQADDPATAILDRYRRFLTTERALASVTVERYVDCLRPFLNRRLSADGLEFGGLTPADVTSFVVARCPRQNSGVAKLTITALRSFLGFLHLDGITQRSLVCAVPSVARRRLAGLPKGLEPDQVRRLLASCDVHTPVGCRDLAILTLLVRLGLRRSEVAGLRLADIDWRAGTIALRGKGNCLERVPLPPDVGRRLAEYLQHARPAKAPGRTAFVRCIAPHHALSASRVSTIVADAARRVLGVSMRIACATPRQQSSCVPALPCRRSASCCVIAAPRRRRSTPRSTVAACA